MRINRDMTTASRLKPYGVIAVAAILAYLPVSSMLFTLRNDVMAIEYPVQHFMSECLRKGEFPSWFNTWNMGFPLQSVLTWGVYSTPQMMTGLLFESNIYILHLEFLFFIMSSGWIMYKLLKTHFLIDHVLALLLACCYMLSGFTAGSSQWLLYITGMTFIPLTLYCLLGLLKKPSFKYAALFAVSYYLLFTNVHIYLTVVSSYALFFFLLLYFTRLLLSKTPRAVNIKTIRFLVLALTGTAFLCAAPAYYSIETITYLERSLPLGSHSDFFQSNYLHPDGLASFLLPLSATKTTHFNTEGTVLDVYIGLLPLILLPLSVFLNLNREGGSKKQWGWLLAALFFLLLSFGHLTPLRSWMNILPGMGNFRHPGVLRVFFNMGFLFYLASSLGDTRLPDLFVKGSLERKYTSISTAVLLFLSLLVLVLYVHDLSGTWKGSLYATVKDITISKLILFSALIQVFFTGLLLFSIVKKQRLFTVVLLTELIINTLSCTPFFTIGNYQAGEVATILQPAKGFPVQQASPFDVPAAFTDSRNNSWPNINTYRKEVSNNVSMPGPLILEKVSLFVSEGEMKNSLKGKQLVFLKDSSGGTIRIIQQLPSSVRAEVSLIKPANIVLQQGDFPGWKAYYNGKNIPVLKNELPFVNVELPAGKGELVFSFEKKGVMYSAIILHILVLLVTCLWLSRKFFIRSSSPS